MTITMQNIIIILYILMDTIICIITLLHIPKIQQMTEEFTAHEEIFPPKNSLKCL